MSDLAMGLTKTHGDNAARSAPWRQSANKLERARVSGASRPRAHAGRRARDMHVYAAGRPAAAIGRAARRSVHNMSQWNDLVALAREIDAALTKGASMDPGKARRLAQMVLAVKQPLSETDGDGGGLADHPGPRRGRQASRRLM